MELPPNTPQPEETAAQGDVFHSACHATAIPPPSLSQNPQSTVDLPSNLHPIQTLPPFLSMPCAAALTPNLPPILTLPPLPPIFHPTNDTNHSNHNQSTVPLTQKCNCKGCPSFPPVQLLEQCGYSECSRVVHYVCYANMIKKSNKDYVVLEGHVFCTIGHQKEYVKGIRTDNLTWSNDGAGGKDDPRCSEHYLIEYLNTDENFSNWRCPHGGVTKLELAANIGKFIFGKGVKVERTAEQVKSKIEWIEGAMRSAYDFTTSQTGEGIKENEGYENFAAKVTMKLCYVVIVFPAL